MNFSKNIRKFRKNARAISPVIATLLMIAIAVVASLVTYAWVMGYMNFQTEKTGQAIQIQSMTNSTTTGKLVVYVQNVGDGSVQINGQSVYVNGAQVTLTGITSTTTILEKSTQTINTDYSLVTIGTNSTTVDVKVTTLGGTFSEVSKTFP
jgi:archaeal type IV pilus assembly protein PilA